MPNPDRFLLPHELPDEFREFLAGLNQAHQPRDAHERMLVQDLADASWARQRARANDGEFWDYMGAVPFGEPGSRRFGDHTSEWISSGLQRSATALSGNATPTARSIDPAASGRTDTSRADIT